jgi:hypothetical protein
MFATNASFHFIKQLCSILFYFALPWKQNAFILLPTGVADYGSKFCLHDSSSINCTTKEKQKNNNTHVESKPC